MENIWICKKCSEEVPSTFDICWNCNFDKSNSTSTFEDIKRETENIEEQLKNKIIDKQLFFDKNIQIDPHKIIAAGRDLKGVVNTVVVMISLVIILALTLYFSENLDTIKLIYLLLGFASLICNIIILFLVHSAGDNLENSVYKKEERIKPASNSGY